MPHADDLTECSRSEEESALQEAQEELYRLRLQNDYLTTKLDSALGLPPSKKPACYNPTLHFYSLPLETSLPPSTASSPSTSSPPSLRGYSPSPTTFDPTSFFPATTFGLDNFFYPSFSPSTLDTNNDIQPLPQLANEAYPNTGYQLKPLAPQLSAHPYFSQSFDTSAIAQPTPTSISQDALFSLLLNYHRSSDGGSEIWDAGACAKEITRDAAWKLRAGQQWL